MVSVQQFLRASTYMLPVSMVLANIYQPYKVRIAMFFCYLFQHGLFIWKLFLVIGILIVISFKWQFFFSFVFPFFLFVKSQDTGNAQHLLLRFTFKTFVLIDWVSFTGAHMSLECRWKGLTVNIWGRSPDASCFCIASKPLITYLGCNPF